ncbi:MAG: PQQ-binding-like beta-propeller repeat protein [Myxococcales bacterium]
MSATRKSPGRLLVAVVFLALPAFAARAPGVNLSPGTGVPGASVTVKGSGFASTEMVDVTFDGTLAGQPRTSKTGAFTVGITVPKLLTPGIYPVRATGRTSGLTAQAAFTVKDPTSITLSPTAGPTGTSVSVTGTLFGNKESVNILFDATPVAIATATSTGSFVQSFIVAADAAEGTHTVTAVGVQTARTAQAVFQVTAPAEPALSASISSGPPTGQVGLFGTAFGKNELVDIYFDTVDVVLGSTSASGEFFQSLFVPANAAPGDHWITAVGRSSGRSAQAFFQVQTDWPQYQFGLRHSGYNAFENVLNPTSVVGLGQARTFATGAFLFASPAVVNGVVFFGESLGGSRLWALDAASNLPLWATDLGTEINSSAAVVDGTVYVGADGLYALDAASGNVLWSFPISAGVVSSPAVYQGIVYFGALDHNFYALDASTGSPVWAAGTGGAIRSSPAIANGVVYFGSEDHNLYAYDASSGNQRWHLTLGGSISLSSPAVANGVVYVGALNTNFYAVNATNGLHIWDVDTPSFIDSSPAVANGLVYIGSGDGVVRAYDAARGALIWSAATEAAIDSGVTVANGVVYVTSADSKVYAFNAVTGAFLWSAATGNSLFSSPVVVNGNVYLCSGDGRLYTYDLPASTVAISAASRLAAAAPTTSGTTSGPLLPALSSPPKAADLTPDYSLKPQDSGS